MSEAAPLGPRPEEVKNKEKDPSLDAAKMLNTLKQRVDLENRAIQIVRDVFDERFNKLDAKVDAFARAHADIDKARLEHGILEAVMGMHQLIGEQKMEKLMAEIGPELANLTVLATVTNYSRGKGKLNMVKERLKFFEDLKQSNYWDMIDTQFSTKEGMYESLDALQGYTTGLENGVLTMLDPHTYVALVEMLGAGTASLIFCNDNWAKVQGVIRSLGKKWDRANSNERCQMIGEVVGGFATMEGLGVVAKVGRAGMLKGVEGTVLSTNIGTIVTNAPALVGKAADAAGKVMKPIAGVLDDVPALLKAAKTGEREAH